MKFIITLSALLLSVTSFAATYECKGLVSGNFYDLTAIDVGDEEGEVVVNNGGAPQHFPAHYDEGTSEDQFIFGFELYNAGVVPELSEIVIAKPKSLSATSTTGVASYFEHDYNSQSHGLIKENLTCTISK
jgi:hypothetical protein